MMKFVPPFLCLAMIAAIPAHAQDAPNAGPTTSEPAAADTTTSTDRAPDGSKAFGFEPYFGVMGGWEQFDNERANGIPQALNPNGSIRRGYKPSGSLVQGVAGFNIPLGPVFVGAEGNAAKGVNGNIDWEYGAAGRFGFRAGDSGLLYGKVGYEWVNVDHFSGLSTNGGNTSRDYHAITYGAGFEVGPKDIGLGGITGRAGIRLRGEVSTFGSAHSFRPLLGIVRQV